MLRMICAEYMYHLKPLRGRVHFWSWVLVGPQIPPKDSSGQ